MKQSNHAQVQAYLRSRGYPLTNSLGMRNGKPSDECIGIFERKPPANPLFVIFGSAFFFNRRRHLANLWLKNKTRDAHAGRYVLSIEHDDGRFEMESLAGDIAAEFRVEVGVAVEGHNAIELWSSSELPDS